MARTATPRGRSIYVPVDSFIADIEGVECRFKVDYTRVSREWLDEHPKLAHLFRPVEVHYDVEAATAAPGEVRA